jgi:hypothetical protein
VPRGIFRGLSLHAADLECTASNDFDTAVAYGLRSLSNRAVAGNERHVLEEFYLSTTSRLEQRATEAWRVRAVEISPPPKAVAFTAPKVDRGALETGITAASGPSNAQGQAVPNGNQHWPNAGSPWSYQFAPKMTEALLSTFGSAENALATEVAKSLKSATDHVSSSLVTAQHKMTELTMSIFQRNEPSKKASRGASLLFG